MEAIELVDGAAIPVANEAEVASPDSTFVRKHVVSSEDLARMSKRSDAAGLVRITLHMSTLACAAYASILSAHTVWAFLAWPLQAALMASMFAPLHEAIHRTAFRTRALNSIVAWVSGLFVFLGPTAYRHFHFEHHRHTQDISRDPELWGRAPGWPPLRDYVTQRVATLLGLGTVLSLGVLIARAIGYVHKIYPANLRSRIIWEARQYCAVYAGIAALCVRVPSATWAVVPWLLVNNFLTIWWSSEHSGCAEAGPAPATTRTMLTNPVLRYFMWNMPYHTEHHAFPSVVFSQLPDLHTRMAPHLQHVGRGYIRIQTRAAVEIFTKAIRQRKR